MRFRPSAREAVWAALISPRMENTDSGPLTAGGCVQTSKHHDVYAVLCHDVISDTCIY